MSAANHASGPALPHGDPDAVLATIARHPFVGGLAVDHLEVLAAHAARVEVEANRFVFRQGSAADTFYLLLEGDVDLEVAGGGAAPFVIESLHGGDALGWSWLFPDQPWLFDAHARSATRALAIDGRRLREAIEHDAAFGRDLTRRMLGLVFEHLHHARLQLVDSWTHDHRA
jgi:CRP/FNR family transcriptional regulator, cyclic AMP receptor protein